MAGFPEGTSTAVKDARALEASSGKSAAERTWSSPRCSSTTPTISTGDFLRGACVETTVSGIIPVAFAGQIKKFSALCGAKLPEAFAAGWTNWATTRAVREYGIEYATAHAMNCSIAGARPIFTLNKSNAVLQILGNLGLADGRRHESGACFFWCHALGQRGTHRCCRMAWL